MSQRSTLHTERLTLRPFCLADAPDVQRLAGAHKIASVTQNIPHPYEDGMAEAWIESHQQLFEEGRLANFCITLRDSGAVIGAIGLNVTRLHNKAELGYWIGVPYWEHGYCTEAARAVIRYGFQELGLNRILARHMRRNPASGRVMQKLGMRREGLMRQDAEKWGSYEDIVCYGLLRREYEAQGEALSCGKEAPNRD